MLKVQAIAVRFTALLLLLLAASFAAEPRRINVYAPQALYQVDILFRDGVDYVGLTDLLEPLGRLESGVDGKKLKLTFNGAEAEFQDGKRQCRVRSNKLDLPSNFLLVDGRGYVPATSVAQLLPRLADQAANFHQASRRLFVGSSEIHYSTDLRHSPSRLVFSFTAPVNPSTVIEKNRVRLLFRREPLVGPVPETVSYNDVFVQSATFAESPAGAELTVNLLQPATVSTGDGGRTVTITATPPPQAPVAAPQNAPAAVNPSSGGQQPHPAPRAHPFVILDAAHGGSETGSMLSPSLAEKNVNLAFARRLQKELEARGVYVVLTRVADNLLTWDQRAVSANTSHSSLYVAIHTSSTGQGVRFYTSVLPATPPSTQPSAQSAPSSRTFMPWDQAQSPFLAQSSAAASALAAQCTSAGLTSRTSAAPLRPLNSVTIPAVAVEIAPTDGNAEELAAPEYQQRVATALATGIAALRDKLEVAH
jgi:N-acetylmuramoyl-L-alanine amidase